MFGRFILPAQPHQKVPHVNPGRPGVDWITGLIAILEGAPAGLQGLRQSPGILLGQGQVMIRDTDIPQMAGRTCDLKRSLAIIDGLLSLSGSGVEVRHH